MSMAGLEDKIDERFLKDHPKVRILFSEMKISEYGQAVKLEYVLLRARGLGPKSIKSLHMHFKHQGFGGVPFYDIMRKGPQY